MKRSDGRRGAKAGANSGRETTEEEKLHGESKDKREEGNGLYRTGRWSTFRFFLFARSFFNHLSATLSLHRPRTLLNCLPLVFTPVPLRYGLSSEEALRDIYSAARVAWIKTGRNQQDERKKEKRNKRNVWARISRTSRDTGHSLIDQVILGLARRSRLFAIAPTYDLFAACTNAASERERVRHGKSRTNGFNERDFRIRYKVFDLTTRIRSSSRVIQRGYSSALLTLASPRGYEN